MRDLSDSHLIRLGQVIVACASLEAVMDRAVWTLAGLNIEDGYIAVRHMAREDRHELLRMMGARHLKWTDQDAYFELLDVIALQLEDRDFLVHADWNDAHWGIAVATSRTRIEPQSTTRLIALARAVRASHAQFEKSVMAMEKKRDGVRPD
jgi:hypothetical protein